MSHPGTMFLLQAVKKLLTSEQILINGCGLAVCFEHGLQIIIQQRFVI